MIPGFTVLPLQQPFLLVQSACPPLTSFELLELPPPVVSTSAFSLIMFSPLVDSPPYPPSWPPQSWKRCEMSVSHWLIRGCFLRPGLRVIIVLMSKTWEEQQVSLKHTTRRLLVLYFPASCFSTAWKASSSELLLTKNPHPQHMHNLLPALFFNQSHSRSHSSSYLLYRLGFLYVCGVEKSNN